VQADNHSTAVSEAAKLYPTSPCVNVWVTRRDDVLFSQPEDKDIWSTLSEKKYREAVAYRAMDRINQFKAEQKQLQ
jgi:ring-1,2-phenylacetyl-CoA epoxidase subunit PaaB